MMAGPEFFQTRMGQTFYEGTLPRLVKALEEIARKLPEPSKRCPHGEELGECTACDVAADLAYDADREDRY